jgi:hydroxymethylbilane synthase
MPVILIGTRGSQLALAQAEMVRLQIAKLLPNDEVQLEIVKTLGDQLSVSEATGSGGEVPQGLFTKELDEALLSGKIRAAIHSLKDVPTVLPPGIGYGALLKREDPRDAFVSKTGAKFFELPAGSRVGTSSPRREAQIRAVRSDLKVIPLRGNVDTRLRKLREGDYEAIVVAAAGLKRLGREKEATELLPPEVLLPSPAQGVLCITLCEGESELFKSLEPLNDNPTRICAEAERAFLKTLQGGCRIPVGALATIEGETLFLSGVVAHPNGEQIMRHNRKGSVNQPKELGDELAKYFLAHGAQEILNGFGRSYL